MSQMLDTRRRVIAGLASIAVCGALPALAADAKVSKPTAAPVPAIKLVSPMRARIGHTMTIRGSGFSASRTQNTVVFGRKGGRVAMLKPDRASKTKLTIRVPTSVYALLDREGDPIAPTRLTLRVVTSRYGKRSTFRHSPLVLPQE